MVLGCLPNFRMDAPRDAAQAHAEAIKVETWCRKEGIKTSAELAFYFTTFEEALSEAGRAVARSWQVARQSSEQGVAGLVRGLFAAERQSQEVVVKPEPSTSPRLRRGWEAKTFIGYGSSGR